MQSNQTAGRVRPARVIYDEAVEQITAEIGTRRGWVSAESWDDLVADRATLIYQREVDARAQVFRDAGDALLEAWRIPQMAAWLNRQPWLVRMAESRTFAVLGWPIEVLRRWANGPRAR